MTSNVFIAFMVAFGAAVYVFRWFYKRTGGNSQKSAGAAAVVGLLSFLILLSLLSLIPE